MLAPVQAGREGEMLREVRRDGVRQRLTMRAAKLRCLGGEYPCILQDVSPTGAKLRLFHAHPPDSHRFLELANSELYAIERRWVDGDFAGYRFSSRIEVEEFLSEPNARPRRPVRLRIEHPVKLLSAGERGHAWLVDLSSQGACIEAGRKLARRSSLQLELPGLMARTAYVCWRREYRHGLAFQEALPLKELARLALELQPFDQADAEARQGDDPVQAIGA